MGTSTHTPERSETSVNNNLHQAGLADKAKSDTIRPMRLNAFLIPAREGGYIAFNPETNTTTQGDSVEEAMENLKEATEIYLEECHMPDISSAPAILSSFEIPAHA